MLLTSASVKVRSSRSACAVHTVAGQRLFSSLLRVVESASNKASSSVPVEGRDGDDAALLSAGMAPAEVHETCRLDSSGASVLAATPQFVRFDPLPGDEQRGQAVAELPAEVQEVICDGVEALQVLIREA